MQIVNELLRRLPAVHRLTAASGLNEARLRWGRNAVTAACREVLDDARRRAREGTLRPEDVEQLEDLVLERLHAVERPAYRPVINATGVLLHTNLGRAPAPAVQPHELAGYLALEYDVERGSRGQRLAPLRARIAEVCGAQSAVMVNNNAASLLLILSALTSGREVIVSRSQLIEIGGSFRLPAVMSAAGCRLVEVGCTNRTHRADYERAIGDETAALLVAHQSNFRIVGFTTSPTLAELADLAHAHDLPFIVDQGSGCLHDLRRWGLPHEHTIGEILSAGADIVCFSGDKLLGGPQAGIIVGRREIVEPLGAHPLYRALRPDKTALSLMDHTLRAHQTDRLEEIPLYAMLNTTIESLRRRARKIGRRLRSQDVPARGLATRAAIGGGTTPAETFASYGLSVPGGQALLDRLRGGANPVVGRVEDDRVILDLRTVFPQQDDLLVAEVGAAYESIAGGHKRQAAGRTR